MTDHELQLKAVALRRALVVSYSQPEGLAELSPGLREALPWVCVPQIHCTLKGCENPPHQPRLLCPFRARGHFWSLPQGSSRCAQTTLGCIPVALQATQRAERCWPGVWKLVCNHDERSK